MTAAKTPRVSVGMPAYNSERTIQSAIDSILSQTFTDLELIIVDNASTDGTVALCEAVAARDPRVRVVRNPVNLGVNPNYRKVAQLATGEFFKWHSTNDLLDPDYLAACVAVLEARADVVLAFGRTVIFQTDPAAGTAYDDRMNADDDEPLVRFRRTADLLRLNNAINGLIRRETLMRTTVHPDYLSSDNIVLSELALEGKIVLVPTTRFFRRMDKGSATALQSTSTVRLAHYPTRKFAQLFQSWRFVSGYMLAVVRSHLPFAQRMRGLFYCLQLYYWASPRLFADFKEAVKYYAVKDRN
jgi:glycosyltransferase involved in cell wall biosynthesis